MPSNPDFRCRCFMEGTVVPATNRRPLWVYTEVYRGAFFHAGRDTIDVPHRSLNDWKEWAEECECTPDEALANLSGWPEAQRYLMHIFDRHRTPYRKEATP